jgi:hypothetical protein
VVFVKKELLTHPDKPVEGGLKVDYEKVIYYPVCGECVIWGKGALKCGKRN